MNLLTYFLKSYPTRLLRFLKFPFSIKNIRRPYALLEWVMLLLDLMGIAEIIQFIHRILHWKQRKLSTREKDLVYPIFQDSITWSNVRLNNRSWICKKFRFAFVGFHTVHFHDCLTDDILVHELVHIWQYEKYGSAYIVRALHAQSSEMGYEYGGILALRKNKHLADFNFEQMAEVIRDAYLNTGRSSIYNKYLKQLLE